MSAVGFSETARLRIIVQRSGLAQAAAYLCDAAAGDAEAERLRGVLSSSLGIDLAKVEDLTALNSRQLLKSSVLALEILERELASGGGCGG